MPLNHPTVKARPHSALAIPNHFAVNQAINDPELSINAHYQEMSGVPAIGGNRDKLAAKIMQ